MTTQKSINLTEGNVFKTLLIYCLPLLGSAIVQQLYSLVDLLIVGNFAYSGQDALTAVGEAMIVVNILMAFGFGANGGCSVIISKYFGAKDNLKVKETVNTSAITFSIMCAVVMALGFALALPSMYALSVEERIIGDSLTYLNVYIASLPFVFAYNIGCGILTALGDSKTPFLFLVFSSVLNVGLDLLFVCVFHLDVLGVAIATLISQAIASVLTVLVLIKRLKGIECEGTPKKFEKALFKQLVVTSIPIVLQNSFVSVGNLFVQKKINMISIDAAAGFTTAFKLVQIAIIAVATMNNGFANFCSQNKAAKKYDRIRQGHWAVVLYTFILSTIWATLLLCLPEQLTLVFIDNPTPKAVEYSVQFLTVVSPCLLLIGAKIVSDGAVRGCGGNVGFTVSTFTDLILRVACVYILVDVGLEFLGVSLAWVIGWSVSTVVALIFYAFIPCLKGVPLFKRKNA